MPDPDLPAWEQLQQQLTEHGQRRLVLLEGDRDSALKWLAPRLAGLKLQPGIWTGPEALVPDPRLACLPATSARQQLGRELKAVVWDGWQGNPPDGLAALSGTLVAGGLLFWLMPPLEDWPVYPDPDYARTGLAHDNRHPFAARLARIVSQDPAVIRVQASTGRVSGFPEMGSVDHPFEVGSTVEQEQLVERLVRLGQGHRRRPLVITADRGRGKSAALGLAAVQLLRSGRQRVLVTAPSEEAVTSLFRHAHEEAFGRETAVSETSPLVLENGATLEFMPVRELLARAPAAELVMVDEAAAIPPYRLQQILLGWPRVAFATTVHGYEGSGRGFEVRFRAVLERETPRWTAVSLSQPVRWAAGDPLEALTRQLFLLDAEYTPPALLPDAPVVEKWQPALAPEPELAEAFGLLVNAHYRTSPADLRQWLDDPDAVSWRIQGSDGTLLGVLWATPEGGLEPDLARQVMLGQRRLRGHLLPQSLASHGGYEEAATQRMLRVVRIAVADSVRNRGLGGQLLAAARDYAGRQGLDALGTSFGGTVELVRFWQGNDLSVVRAGLQREASSGEYPIQMLQGLSEAGQGLQQQLAMRLSEHWLTLVPLCWRDMDAALAGLLTASLPPGPALNEEDRRDLFSFAHGHRGFLLSLPVLRALARQPGISKQMVESRVADLWCRSVLQGWSWQELRDAGLCSGRRDAEQRLRQAVAVVPGISPNL